MKRLEQASAIEPVDAVKLAFQSAFGCGHLLTEEADCARRIAGEMETMGEDVTAPPFTDIGGGLCRLNLRAKSVRGLSPTLLARMMAETERLKTGCMEDFFHRLEALRRACDEGRFPFDRDALDGYLAIYAKQGYPPVSHSDAYRKAYRPAYRVVLRGYGDALPILHAMEARIRRDGACLAVLDGSCASGKSTLANLIAPLYRASLIPMDAFFLPPELRTPERLGEAGGNIHHERFRAEVLEGLARFSPFSYQRYDCHRDRMEVKRFTPTPVILIEGSYSHHPAFAPFYERLNALRIWIRTEPSEQLRRLRARNPALLNRFVREWIPMEEAYLRAFDGEGKADLTVHSLPWEKDWA